MTGTGERLANTHALTYTTNTHAHSEAGWRRAALGFTVTCYTILRLPAPGTKARTSTRPGWSGRPRSPLYRFPSETHNIMPSHAHTSPHRTRDDYITNPRCTAA